MFLSVGSGSTKYENTINMDMEKLFNVDVVGDIRNIPFGDEYFEGIIAVHILEHFWKYEHMSLIKEWKRVIKPNGKIYINCPDFIKCLKNYLENKGGLRYGYWEQTIFGMNRSKGDVHLSGITKQYLEELLFKNDFVNLKWEELDGNNEHNISVTATKKCDQKNKEDKVWQL